MDRALGVLPIPAPLALAAAPVGGGARCLSISGGAGAHQALAPGDGFAHFALSDVAEEKHYAFDRFSRGAGGLAGAQSTPFRAWVEGWTIDQVPDSAPIDAAGQYRVIEYQWREHETFWRLVDPATRRIADVTTVMGHEQRLKASR